MKKFYQINNHDGVIEKFEREHIPLDGKSVTMLPFRVDSLFGFVANNKTREWLIQPQYDQVFAMYGDMAIVKKGRGYGLINSKNEVLMPFVFKNLFKENDLYHGFYTGINKKIDFSDMFLVNAYADSSGKILFDQKAHEQKTFIGTDSLAWFRYRKEYTIRSKTGNVVRTFKYQDNNRFMGISNNLLLFEREEKGIFTCYAYDLHDKLVFTLPILSEGIDHVLQLDEKLFGLVGNDNAYFFTDEKGMQKPYNLVSSYAGFSDSDPNYFDKEIFMVTDRKTQRYGAVSRKGATVIDFRYRYISEYVDSICFAIDSSGNTLFLNKNGKVFLDISKITKKDTYKYSLMVLQQYPGFYEGLCIGQSYEVPLNYQNEPVDIEDLEIFYYFDKSGKTILKLTPEIKFAGNFAQGLAPAVNSEKGLGFIGKDGKWVIAPEYELTRAGAYPFPYIVVPEFKGGFAYIKSYKGYIDKDGNKLFSGKRLQDHYNFHH